MISIGTTQTQGFLYPSNKLHIIITIEGYEGFLQYNCIKLIFEMVLDILSNFYIRPN